MLTFTGERAVPVLRDQISYEHLHRYAIAAHFAGGKRVLDIASGEGYGAALLARGAVDVIGVDDDPVAVEHASRHHYAANVRFVVGSCGDVPIAYGAIDLVVSFDTIEHVNDQERMLDEACRVLAPDGTLLLSSPNKLVYSDATDFAKPFHVKELYFSDLRDLLARRFRYVRFFGQRIAALSLVHPLAGAVSGDPVWFNGTADRIEVGLPTVDSPMYFIAICSNVPIDEDLASAFIDPRFDLLENMRESLIARGNALAAPAVPALAPARPEATRRDDAGDSELARRMAEEASRADSLRASADELRRDVLRWRSVAQSAVADLEQERLRSRTGVRDGGPQHVHRNGAVDPATAGAAQAAADARESELNGAIDELRTELAVAAERLTAAENALTAAQDELERADRDRSVLREVLASHSWKVTYPLRRLVSLVRG